MRIERLDTNRVLGMVGYLLSILLIVAIILQ
jgi:hypothetical protein